MADAAGWGLRLIGYDRPGYGRSTPCPGYSIADCAGDVRAICAALEIDRLAMWGISGGGPYPLACAALLPDLVAAAASLASSAPYEAEGLDWFAGMEEDDVDGNRMLLSDREAARAKMDKDRDEALATTASELAQALGSFLSPADAAVMDDQMTEYLTYCDHEGLAPGSQGWWDDACAHVRAWGFELSDISVPVLLLHGRQDKFVPFSHGQWLAAHIPGAEAWLTDTDGHLTLVAHRVGEVHAWLSEHL